MNIGVIVATKAEREPFSNLFESALVEHRVEAYEVTVFSLESGDTLYLALSSFGELAAASCTQYLIDKFNVDIIINYGVAGSLTHQHVVRDVGFVRKIVHYDFDLSASGDYAVGEYPGCGGQYLTPREDAFKGLADFGIKEFICASGDKFVDGTEAKAELREKFGADICEMEAAGIVITCNRNKIPCAFIKAVSDGADEGAVAFDKNIYLAAKKCAALVSFLII